ncbi:MAG: AAA family ATPase [Saprospiraceae bacterium]|nr:AAA family ATPase [Saprospiraceae bacterium]
MIRLIETRNFRSLKYISQPLDNFHVLVGANASGKTTFLDAIKFISDLVKNGVDYAITERTENYLDLTFGRQGGDIELAVELEMPEAISSRYAEKKHHRIRYEVRIGLAPETQEHTIREERVLLLKTEAIDGTNGHKDRMDFPDGSLRETLVVRKPFARNTFSLLLSKGEDERDVFYPETLAVQEKHLRYRFYFGAKKSALGNMPADNTLFPSAMWLKNFLEEGVRLFFIEGAHMRKASPPGQSKQFSTDGSNLPWVVEDLKRKHKDHFRDWIKHIRTALPDVKDIITVERADDKHRYLKMLYNNGMEIPGWMVSDGTLRLLALTLPAYLPDFKGVYLIEEPENGIHPLAIETVYQSLASVYDAQILVATHSPVLLSLLKPAQVLCFAKTEDGTTDIVRGDEHPVLKNWNGQPDLSILFAGGVFS